MEPLKTEKWNWLVKLGLRETYDLHFYTLLTMVMGERMKRWRDS